MNPIPTLPAATDTSLTSTDNSDLTLGTGLPSTTLIDLDTTSASQITSFEQILNQLPEIQTDLTITDINSSPVMTDATLEIQPEQHLDQVIADLDSLLDQIPLQVPLPATQQTSGLNPQTQQATVIRQTVHSAPLAVQTSLKTSGPILADPLVSQSQLSQDLTELTSTLNPATAESVNIEKPTTSLTDIDPTKTVFHQIMNTDMQAMPDVVELNRLAVADQPVSGLQPASGQAVSMQTTSIQSSTSASELTADIDIPVGQKGWSEAVGQKVSVMLNQKLDTASLQLDPPELGPLNIEMNVDQQEVRLTIVTHHATTKDALDQTLPRLREMLENEGYQLTDSQIDYQSSNQQERDADQRQAHQPASTSTVVADNSQHQTSMTIPQEGGLDAYA